MHGFADDFPGCLFVALAGEKFDAHNYVSQAVEKGAGGLVVHCDDGTDRNPVPTILVGDTLTALGDLAHDWRRAFCAPVIGVTGSSGKTTTKEMIAGILERGKTVLKTQGNLNNLIGLPLTLLGLAKEHEMAVVELGTNRPGEIARLTEIAEPDVAVITNVGPAHLEGFGSLAGVWAEKSAIFGAMAAGGAAVINLDDEYVRSFETGRVKRSLTFGFDSRADVSTSDVRYEGATGVSFTLRIGEAKTGVVMSVSGKHNIQNALAAAASAWAVGIPHDEIVRGLEGFRPIAGRMEILSLANGAFVIDDTYNANPASVGEALRTLQALKGRGQGIAVLGDMLELGGEAERRHRDIGALLAETGILYAYLRGKLSRVMAAEALARGMKEGHAVCFEEPQEIMEELLGRIGPGDWVLVKGSRRMKMEEMVAGLVKAIGRADNPVDGKGGIPA